MAQISLEAWMKLLDQYLQEAELAVLNGDASDRQKIRKKMHLFIRSTPHRYEFLDDIVRQAIIDLNDASLTLSTENIRKAAIELSKQRNIIAVVVMEASQNPSETKMEDLAEKINQTAEVLEKLKEVNEILKEDSEFSEKIAEIIEKLKDLNLVDDISKKINV